MNAGRPRGGAFSSMLAAASSAAGIGFLAMIPFSFMGYTSVGFDLEYQKGQSVVEDFYRIRWPGDGSFRVGIGSIHYNLDEEDVDPIDLGFRFLEPPQYRLTATSWCRFAVATRVPEGHKGEMKSSNWLIVPSWFPAVLFLIHPVLRFRRHRKAGTRAVDIPTPSKGHAGDEQT